MTPTTARALCASVALIAFATAACSAPPEGGLLRNGSTDDDDEQTSAKLPPKSDGSGAPSSNGSSNGNTGGAGGAGGAGGGSSGPGTPTTPGAGALPYLTPTQTVSIKDASQVWSTAGGYKGTAPAVNANDRHPAPVTGKNCLSCHDGTGKAPRFAFGGTVADGKQWKWEASSWLPGPPSMGWGGYGASSPSGVYGSGGWQSGKKGGPEQRSDPSPNAEVRVIGTDGLVFETVTDRDGNYWYKTKAELKQPAHTGIRKGAFIKALKSNGAACATCHESGGSDSPGRIWTWEGKEPTWSPFPF